MYILICQYSNAEVVHILKFTRKIFDYFMIAAHSGTHGDPVTGEVIVRLLKGLYLGNLIVGSCCDTTKNTLF